MRFFLLPFALIGCPGTPADSGSDDKPDTDTGEPDDTNETGDTEETGDSGDSADTGRVDTGDTADTAWTDSGDSADTGWNDSGETGDTAVVEPILMSVSWDFTEQTINTRDALLVAVTATWDDGSTTDVTAESTYASTDEWVAKIYTAGRIQPLGEGVVTVSASYGGMDVTGALTVEVVAAVAGDLVFNEILADGTVDGDPNGDGIIESAEDEYLEIANYSDVTVDLSGLTIVEDDFYTGLPRHTFAEGTFLRAGEAIVVFGGGDVSSLVADNVQFLVAANADSGLQYGLSLNNEGEYVELQDATGTLITSVWYGPSGTFDAVEDASMVLTPDVWGTTYTHHKYATGSISDYSVGLFVDGTAFPGPDGRYGP